MSVFGGFLLKRTVYGAFVLLGVTLLAFMLLHLTGDPAAALLPLGTPPEQIAQFRVQAGLDRPVLVQFGTYVAQVVRGEWGTSLRHREPALGLVLERLPATLALGAAGLSLAVLIAAPLGVWAAARPGSAADRLAGAVATFGLTVPGFWLGVMLILLFGVTLRWLPVSGGAGWRALVMPAVVVAATPAGSLLRLLRSELRSALQEDYIRTAYAKGVSDGAVLWRHGLRNALIPTVTLLSVHLGALFGGALVAEVVFAYPGMGQLAMQAMTNRDIPVVQAFIIVQGAVIVAINIALDGLYARIDPRVRYE